MNTRIFLVMLTLAFCACTELEPRYCELDSECRDPTNVERYNPDTPYCNSLGNFCFSGCKSDAECSDHNSLAFEGTTKPTCDKASGHCVGGGDLPNTGRLLGEKCTDKGECKSGICVDGVCCDSACEGTCIACTVKGSEGRCVAVPDGDDIRGDCAVSGTENVPCKGTCDGNKTCRYPDNKTACGALCVPGSGTLEDQVKKSFCDGAGTCLASATDESCGGYACKDGKCGTTCDTSAAPCTGSVFQCVNKQCVANLANGTACGTNDKACKSGHCVDGVCCESTCDGTCEQCDSTGTCVPYAVDTDPEGECVVTSQPAACAGKCDGASGCKWPATECRRTCGGSATAPLVNVFTCSQGSCSATPTSTEDCKFSLCNTTTNACPKDCATKSDCVSGSICDRTAAHANGRGLCVDPGNIVMVSTTIQAAVTSALGASKTHVVIPGSATPYTAGADITNGAITLIGDGTVTVRPTAGAGFSVTGGGLSLSLQNITVNQSPDVGVTCGSLGTQSKLVIVESTISRSAKEGVFSTKCDVVLRRNTINNNAGGGASLSTGVFAVVNNLIFSNGGNTASVAGINLVAPAVGSVAAYNTITANIAQAGGTSGVLCGGPNTTLTNNIVRGNVILGAGGQELLGCTLTNSDIPGGSSSNIDQDPLFVDSTMNNFSLKTSPPSPCINAGTANPTGATVLDIVNTPRKKGTSTDIGAYEVQ